MADSQHAIDIDLSEEDEYEGNQSNQKQGDHHHQQNHGGQDDRRQIDQLAYRLQYQQQQAKLNNLPPTLQSEGSLQVDNSIERIVVGAPSTTKNSDSLVPNQKGPSSNPLIGEKLSSILKSIDPSFELTPESEEYLLVLADKFVQSVVEGSCLVALNREICNSNSRVPSSDATKGLVNPNSDLLKTLLTGTSKISSLGAFIDSTDVSLVLRERWGTTITGLSSNPLYGSSPRLPTSEVNQSDNNINAAAICSKLGLPPIFKSGTERSNNGSGGRRGGGEEGTAGGRAQNSKGTGGKGGGAEGGKGKKKAAKKEQKGTKA